MIEITGMKLEIVGVHGDIRVLELDDHLDAFAFVASGEVEQRMLVQAELRKHAVETRFWHAMILMERGDKSTTEDTENTEGFR